MMLQNIIFSIKKYKVMLINLSIVIIKVLNVLVSQSRLTLCNSTDCSLPGSFVREDSPGKNTGVGCHAFLQGIFHHLGIKPTSLTSPALTGGFFTTGTTWETQPTWC